MKMRPVKRFLLRAMALPSAERWTAIEALITLAVARVVLALLPFTRAMACFGLRPRFEGAGAQQAACADRMVIADAVQRAVRRASKVAPFRAVCLQQAVAASLMLRRRGMAVEVHFGVAKDSIGAVNAHAWSVCMGTVITGGFALDGYARIAVFAESQAQERAG